MPIIPQDSDTVESDNSVPYRTSFVNHSHQVLKMGYDRVDLASLATSEEETITGRLTKAMQDALEDSNAPAWATNFWAVEEVRVNDGDREGKRRLRIDIEMLHLVRGKKPRFRFEAKRLRDSDSRRDYLGHDGLGCFLDGRYAATDIDAGMLGYVQEGTDADHAIAISAAILKDPIRFKVAQHGGWEECCLVTGLQTYASWHQRLSGLPDIQIFHTLLTFH
jgi:hypothetical protein